MLKTQIDVCDNRVQYGQMYEERENVGHNEWHSKLNGDII